MCYALSFCPRIPSLLFGDATGDVQESHELERNSNLPPRGSYFRESKRPGPQVRHVIGVSTHTHVHICEPVRDDPSNTFHTLLSFQGIWTVTHKIILVCLCVTVSETAQWNVTVYFSLKNIIYIAFIIKCAYCIHSVSRIQCTFLH